jgi:hypothetical protein
MLEEFDPMCDDAAFIKKQMMIQEALSNIKRAEELMERDEERRRGILRAQGQILTTPTWTYGTGGGTYFPTQTYRYPTAETTYTTGNTVTWTINWGENP